MVTVQQIVARELERNPFLVEILQQQIANITAVALKLQPSIEAELRKKIKVSAISMAIRRAGVHSNRIFQWPFPENLEISTKSNIYEVAIEKTPEILPILKYLYRHIKRHKGEFISIIEGTYEIAIFTNQTNKRYVREALKSQKITSELDNLAYITVNWEKGTKDIPGIYYRITRALAFRGIAIQSFHTIGAEMMIFFKENVLIEAYQIVVQLLKNRQKI